MDPIRLVFASRAALEQELQRNLRTGGAFCPGAAPLPERAQCLLSLVHPDSGAELQLSAEVVYVKPDEPGRGVGFQLLGFDSAVLQRLTDFVMQPAAAPAPAQGDDAVGAEEPAEQKLAAAGLQDRLRGLSLAAQQRLAREGCLTERVALERLFGKTVWEAILHNPRVSPAEVARIARMGMAPAALLDQIVGNAAWLASGEVRRALLSNPRLTDDGIGKVLRQSPRHEVQLIANQTAYHAKVRRVAKAMLTRA
jgi:hypothetical protein